VVAIGGDGGFNVMLGELETARRVGRGLNPRNTCFSTLGNGRQLFPGGQ
jgi:thiamine pyrophosphate-dependent acetolactate synthase large subunit-like protein